MSTVMDEEFEGQNDDVNLEHGSHEGFDDDLDVDAGAEAEMARARRMGWAPKDEFRGDPERWVDHEEFLRRGEEKLPILQERLRKQDEQIEGMRRDMRKVIREQGEYQRQTREAARKEFEDRKRAAVEEADTTTFDQVSREQREWEEQNPPAATESEGDTSNVDPNYPAWHENNAWYGTDEKLTTYANRMGAWITKNRPELVGSPEFYDEVESLVRKQYPNKFENPRRDRPSTVTGGRGPAGGDGKRKTYADLPAAAKRKCDEYIENGYIADQNEYVSAYFDEGEEA